MSYKIHLNNIVKSTQSQLISLHFTEKYVNWLLYAALEETIQQKTLRGISMFISSIYIEFCTNFDFLEMIMLQLYHNTFSLLINDEVDLIWKHFMTGCFRSLSIEHTPTHNSPCKSPSDQKRTWTPCLTH